MIIKVGHKTRAVFFDFSGKSEVVKCGRRRRQRDFTNRHTGNDIRASTVDGGRIAGREGYRLSTIKPQAGCHVQASTEGERRQRGGATITIQ